METPRSRTGMSRAQLDEALLAAQSRGLRALALAIVRDPNAADDVLQDAYARVLAAPATGGAGIAGWLRVVVRGLARNRARDEALRRDHEARAARERRTSTAEEDETRADTLRAVVDAVLALDEPYRRTVLARYFEGLEPLEIAARDGVPVASVATRLKRARVRLRETLEPRLAPHRGGLAGALALACGLDRARLLADSPAPAAAALSKQVAIGTGLAAACLLVWLLARSTSEPELVVASRGESEASVSADADVHDAAAPSASSAESFARTPTTAELGIAPRAASSASDAADENQRDVEPARAPYLYRLNVEALDRELHPLGGAVVAAAPAGGLLNELGVTDALGKLERQWRGYAPKLELVLQLRHAGEGVSPLVRVALTPKEPGSVRLALHAPELPEPDAEEDALRLEEELVEVYGAIELSEKAREHVQRRLTAPGLESGERSALEHVLWRGRTTRARLFRPANADSELPLFALDAEGNGVFADPWLCVQPQEDDERRPAAAPQRPEEMRQRAALRVLSFAPGEVADLRTSKPRRGTRRGERQFPMPNDATAYDAGVTEVRVRLFASPGEPAREVPVSIVLAERRVRLYLHTDEAGIAAARVPAAGVAHVFVGGAGWPSLSELVRCDAGVATLERLLPRADLSALRLVGGEAGASAAWTIEAYPPERPLQLAAHALTDQHGRAVLALPDAGPWRLLARHGDASSELAALLAPAAWLGPGEREFIAPPGASAGTVRVAFAAASGRQLLRASARLWSDDGGQGLALVDTQDSARTSSGRYLQRVFASPRIRGGVYLLDAGGPGQRWSSFGEVRVPAEGALELGVVPFRDAATLELDTTLAELPGADSGRGLSTAKLDAAGRPTTGRDAELGWREPRVSVEVTTRRDGVIVRGTPAEVRLPATFTIQPGACEVTLGYDAPLAPRGSNEKPQRRRWTERHVLQIGAGHTERISVGDARVPAD